ncbi:hypothetical protein GIB67_023414 [Kingdonia uniflora]|uniref:Uncharacterized protein n=1 Tax=Kingdonia uniflora TaxID=39325 RepID=A0A7J7LQW7_9MAGN|nr:hypothetical protein GIB67_023414 [Kingdonia uniflora]
MPMTSKKAKEIRGAEVPKSGPNGDSEGIQNMRPSHGRTSGPTRRSTKGQWTPEEWTSSRCISKDTCLMIGDGLNLHSKVDV